MFVNIADEKGRIEMLQRMLRYLAIAGEDDSIRADVSGVYDEGTEMAVRSFQSSRGLTVTGIADLVTWEILRAEYESEVEKRTPVMIRPIPNNADYETKPAERGDVVVILQAMLSTLRHNYNYPAVTISGVYSPQTADAVRVFQEANGLSATGRADRVTWQRLADEFNAFYGG